MAENSPRFNLIDEPWLPIATCGRMSLKDVFTSPAAIWFGGSARQKIALLKLLLAIGQAAATPADDDEWAAMKPAGLAERVLAYLQDRHDKFYLYGPQPFLQMPLQKAKSFDYGDIQPEIATGNNPRFMHSQCPQALDDGDRAVLLVTLQSMGLGGKGGRGDNTFAFSKNVTKKTAPPGPGLGHCGILHSFLTGSFLIETLWLNLLSQETISGLTTFPEGLGTPPWEKMPHAEDDEIAENLKSSYLGRLVPLSRFCLLDAQGIRFTQGLTHPAHTDGVWDLSASERLVGKDHKLLWCDPDKRPWRTLSARLAFLDSASDKNAFSCLQLKHGIDRLYLADVDRFGIWSGGMRVSSNAGEQYLTGTDDNVESAIQLSYNEMSNESWYPNLCAEMAWLDKISRMLYAAVAGYASEMGKKGRDRKDGDDMAKAACALFWEKGEALFHQLLAACHNLDLRDLARAKYKNLARDAYSMVCPADSAKQLEKWAKYAPFGRGEVSRGVAEARKAALAASAQASLF